MKLKIHFTFPCILFVCMLSIILLTSTTEIAAASGEGTCKELNNFNCYVGQNEGNFCNSKDPTKAVTRWYFDKGVCRSFIYKGCNGNRNRFCTQKSCEARCVEL